MSKSKKEYVITVSGVDLLDIELGIDEAKKGILRGFLTGMDWHEDREYKFESSGEFEEDEDAV